jgi:hypothetical protein
LFCSLATWHGNDFLPYFIASIEKAARNGLGYRRNVCELSSVHQLVGGEYFLLWKGGMSFINEPVSCLLHDAADWQNSVTVRDVTLIFQTLTRLQNEGRLTTNVEFSLIMRAVFRRLDLLCRSYGEGEREIIPFKNLLEEASTVKIASSNLRWVDWARYSARQKTKLLMGGLVGEVVYKGVPSGFIPYLQMASVVHLGKGTVYGLGTIEVR